MLDFTRYVATRLRRLLTPQSAPIPGTAQVPNSAGGFAWEVGPWARLDRFLILGSEGGTYYVGERTLTVESAHAVTACLDEDGARVVARVVEVSEEARAPKNDPALFVLAMAAAHADEATRAAAFAALPRVARTGTHLFHWMHYLQAFRGWGRGARGAVARWYLAKPPRALAYQLLKYPSRDGWSHRDALRLSHPKPDTEERGALFRRAVQGRTAAPEGEGEALDLVRAADRLHADPAPSADEAAALVRAHRLTREMVPTGLLRSPGVWAALLEEMPLTAMVRSLAVMTQAGLLAPGSEAAAQVAARLADAAALRRARVHPVQLLSALTTYARGHGVRSSLAWEPVAEVVDALDRAFYLAFRAVEPTGRRTMLALDVSGSMTTPAHGLPGVSCREASAAMALVTAATEPHAFFTAFTAVEGATWGPENTALTPLAISPRQRLDDVVRAVSDLPFGGTDCALPVTEALRRGWEVETFVVYTDSETWAGRVHPAQALREYRERTGIPAKLVVVAMASDGFTIADPDDPGMLDVVGFDASAPAVIADFAR